jgi:putative iron-regulated protein
VKSLQDAVLAFLTVPAPDSLQSVRQAWLSAHQSFLKASFYWPLVEGRTAADAGGPEQLFNTIDVWPMQEGFLDSVQYYPTSGIINDLTLSIDRETLRNQHGITDAEEVSLGFHAMEFLLWDRQVADFVEQTSLTDGQTSGGLSVHQLSNNRRRETLKLISTLLYEDIMGVYQPSASDQHPPPSAAAHRLEVAIHACTRALQRMRGELQLLTPGDDSGGHSRFSGSSVQDLLTSMQTLAHVYSDPGRLHERFEALDPVTADQFGMMIDSTLQKLTELTDSKVDQAALLELSRRFELMPDQSQQFEIMNRQ